MLRIMTEPTFTTDNGLKWYGPIAIKNVTQPWLCYSQRQSVCSESPGTWPWIEGCFFWLAQRARHNARHALAIGRGLSRPIEVSRLLQRGPSAAEDEVENIRWRISTRPPNINRHPARAARTHARPATGTSVAPGDRPTRTPVIPKPHLPTPEMHRATMRPGAGGGSPEAGPPPDAPPGPGPHAGHAKLGAVG